MKNSFTVCLVHCADYLGFNKFHELRYHAFVGGFHRFILTTGFIMSSTKVEKVSLCFVFFSLQLVL